MNNFERRMLCSGTIVFAVLFLIAGIWMALPWKESTQDVEYDGKIVRCTVWSKWPMATMVPVPVLPKPDYSQHPAQYVPPSIPEREFIHKD
jgi:hypothetical protein